MEREILISGSVYAGMKGINWGWCLLKKIAISDNIEVAKRSSSAKLVLEYLKKAKHGMERHQKDGYPWFIRRKQEDMGILYKVITDLIDDLEKNPENLNQVKQKITMGGIDFESIIKKNHYFSFRSPAFAITVTSELILLVIIISILAELVMSSTSLLP